ncbi:HEAT repeat domain-containing protein [Bdellovibrio sp. KM01]|uniref:HEAT repeat domain-containing protein n=1 Tax=Bdellovibrio sp. KM01 TaxID=2748865 RepID=UPI0015EA0E05|nr:HEAT repeat domain-containing protein [Bdellovibrio sp. KM01]QLY24298.1 HEAT repeat domain-containing protein [Bdellovibrio sp. KM01]
MRTPKKYLSTLLTTTFLFALPSFSYAQKVGFESEFATAGFMEAQWGEKQRELSKTMLEIVKANFAGQGEIVTIPWAKYPEKNLTMLAYKDPRGRMWSVDPESVNTTGLDGVEFVTPALDSQEDIERYSKIMKAFRKTGLLTRGLRSSNHVTVDVSHLTKDPNNISKLVDLILTIENHWIEIYRFFDPIRYGTIINRFSVPLALDQQDLLKELAALPENQRTYSNVRNLFLKYDQLEDQLRNGDGKNAVRKWKYRAANYGKLFRLAPDSKAISAIEFRIGDLDFGSRIEEKAEFVKKLVSLETLDKTFKSPFGDKVLDWKQGTEALTKSQLNTDFLKNLVSAESLALIEKKEVRKANQNTADVDLLDMNRPVEKNGKFVTYGFEAEFENGARAKSIIKDNSAVKINTFPYLEGNFSMEDTGNLEVRSIGGERNLGEVLEQMDNVKTTLREDLRGFHMHMRIPAEIISQHDPEILKAWLSNISDAVFAWRLQNRQHFFALKAKTQQRLTYADGLEMRGPIRLIPLDKGGWDIEIRGYMSDSERIGMMAQKIVTGLMNPSLISTSLSEQRLISSKKMTLEESLKKFNKVILNRNMSDREIEIAQQLSKEVYGEGVLPLYDFATLFDNQPIKKRKIQDATMTFFKEVTTVIRNDLSGKYTEQERSKQFRWRIKRWAQAIDLQTLMEQRILRSPTDSKGKEVIPYAYDREASLQAKMAKGASTKWTQLMDELSQERHAWNVSRTITDIKNQPGFYDLLETLFSQKKGYVAMIDGAALSLSKDTSARASEILLKNWDSISNGTRTTLLMNFTGRTDNFSLDLLEKVIASEYSYGKMLALAILKERTEERAVKIIGKAMRENDLEIRSAAVSALARRTDPASFALLKKALQDPSSEVSDLAIRGFNGRNEAEIPLLLKKITPARNERLTIILEALQGKSDPITQELAMQSMSIALKKRNIDLQVASLRTIRGELTSDLSEMVQKAFGFNNRKVTLAAAMMLAQNSDPKAHLMLFSHLDKVETNYLNEILDVSRSEITEKLFNAALASKGLYESDRASIKRSYILRFGSLNAKPTAIVNSCQAVFQ